MPQVRLARIARLVAWVAKIALRDHPKRADGRQRSGVIAVQLVSVITVDHILAFEAAREFEALQKHIAGVVIAFTVARITVAGVLVAVTRIFILVIGCPPASQLDPVHPNLVSVVTAIPWIAPSRIVIKHRRLLPATGLAGLS